MIPLRYCIPPLILSILITGCLGPVKELYPEKKQQRTVSAYVIDLGWHTGIAFEGVHLRERLPGHDRLPETDYLMVGWGDDRYYPAERAGVWLFLRAALLPSGSVIHVVGFDGEVQHYFPDSDMVRVQLSSAGMDEMAGYIAQRFRRDEEEELIYVAEGLYPDSAFYGAKGVYIFPITSNTWTARVLRKSGFPITPFYAITSGNVMRQAGKAGAAIRR